MKRITVIKCFYIFILAITMIGVCGCGMNRKDSNYERQEVIYGARQHLLNKYGYIDCVVSGVTLSGWDYAYDVVYFSIAINGESEELKVERREENGQYVYYDNYFGYIIQDEFEAKIKEYTEKYFPRAHVSASTTTELYPNSLTSESTLDDLRKKNDEMGKIFFVIIVDETFESVEEFDSAAKGFVEEWSALEFPSKPIIYYVTKEAYELEGGVLLNEHIIKRYEE